LIKDLPNLVIEWEPIPRMIQLAAKESRQNAFGEALISHLFFL